ncbi:hypothetical protein [Nocardia aobensis]|uniref:hypothetical protein n=1 Tax=Nocardia aobensis TaxID=257277 RepID=UPI0012F70011|nr:hypothetical protein [Nocardia aobensis]
MAIERIDQAVPRCTIRRANPTPRNVDEYDVIPDNDTNPRPLTSGIEPVTIICPDRDRRIRSTAGLAPRPHRGQNSTHNEFNAR